MSQIFRPWKRAAKREGIPNAESQAVRCKSALTALAGNPCYRWPRLAGERVYVRVDAKAGFSELVRRVRSEGLPPLTAA